MTGRVPIVLCCAEEAEPTLIAAVDALHRDGYLTEVVVGVEADATLLTAAVDRLRGAALFVLCQSEDLDRSDVRRLEGLFSARRGPDHSMITVDIASKGPMAVVPEVRIAARSGGAGDDTPEDDGRHMRDVVMPSMVTAPGASIPSRPRRHDSVAQEPLGISEEALGLPPEAAPIAPPRKVYPEPDVLISTDPTGETVSPFDNMRFDPSRMSDGVPREVAQDFPVVGESSQDVEIAGAPSRVNYDPSGSIGIEKVSRRAAQADPRAETDAAPLPTSSAPIPIGDPGIAEEEEPEEAPERRGGRLGLLLLAGAGMAGVVAMAVMHGSAPTGAGPAGAAEQRGVPTQRGAPKTPSPPVTPAGDGSGGSGATPSVADGSSGSDAAGLVESSSGAEPASATTGSSGGSGSGGSEDVGASESGASTAAGTTGAMDAATDDGAQATGAGADAAGDDGDGSRSPKSVPPPPTADPSRAQLDAAIEAALAAGRLEALDELLVSRAGASTMTWDEANGKCRRRKVEGLRSWRLPSKGQLMKLRKAKLLPSGSYWSRSVVGGDEVYALDAGSGRMNVWLKMEPNARAICVRKRPSEP